MTTFWNDTLTEASTVNLTAHTAETGGGYSKHPNFTSANINVVGGAGYATGAAATTAIYLSAATPPGADYSVFATIERGPSGSVYAGVIGRGDATASTFYQLYYLEDTGLWRLDRTLSGGSTPLGTYTASFATGAQASIELRMAGTSIKAFIDGVERISATDSNITAAGRVGLRTRDGGRILQVSASDGAADTTAPTLTSASGTGGTGVCSGSVSTNEANGTLYVVATASSTAPSAAQVKAGQDNTGAAALRVVSQAVSATGTQSIASGTVSAGTRYLHFMHEDAAGNQSSVATSSSFVVTSSGDTTAPVLSSPVGTKTGYATATVGATTDEGNGTMYAVVTTSSTQPSVSQIKAGQNNGGTSAAWSGSVAVSSTGAKTLSATGLTGSTTYYAHLVHTDAATNDSNRVTSSSFTTDPTPTGPTINTHPSNQTVTSPATATFTVSATASAGSLTYQWQREPAAGGGFTNISSATSSSYTTGATSVTGGSFNNGDKIRCAVTDTNGTTNSNQAVLTVNAATGSFTSSKCRNGAETLLNGEAVSYALHVGASIDDFATLDDFPPEKGTGTLDSNGQLTKSGHTLGSSLLLISAPDGAVFVEPVTVV